MKKLNNIMMCFMSLLMVCCSQDSLSDIEVKETNKKEIQNKGSLKENKGFIIRYNVGTTDEEKTIIRSEYGVETYKQCSCFDEELELWNFAQSLEQTVIEEKKNTASDDPDLDGLGDNDQIQVQNNIFGADFLNGNLNQALSLQVDQNENVTIAILDTGVNYIEGGFTEPFLYNNRKNEQCETMGSQDFFGWDFVNGDNDPYDDNNHGTYMARIINDNLKEKNIPHQLLIVKVFDEEGKTDVFTILCGLKYILSKPDVDIINMSFGIYSYQELFDRFLGDSIDKTLIVTSAGNEENNNDFLPHYPSSYDHENILAVAGLKDILEENIESQNNANLLAWYSNYGVNSVDVAAPSENYSFVINGQNLTAQGTSFSSAFATYKSAELYTNNMHPITLKNIVINNSVVFASGLETIKYRSALLD
ncbi:S8 family serine peptidase [uncultured Lacinutrix sp.]|uniref:S8 family peptidase n=1 Tax=uncultured Lacinutrix sp. TaxID=574032 RepID=UPI00260C18C9|nr:S8 family serine peptidase [uncultured Lacinutrix sp.]